MSETVLPISVLQTIESTKAVLFFFVMLSISTFFWSAIWFSCLLGFGDTALYVGIVNILIGWLAYKSAVSSSFKYAETIRAACDIHRLKLLYALGFEPVSDLSEERKKWAKVVAFLFRGKDHDLRYAISDRNDKEKQSKLILPTGIDRR